MYFSDVDSLIFNYNFKWAAHDNSIKEFNSQAFRDKIKLNLLGSLITKLAIIKITWIITKKFLNLVSGYNKSWFCFLVCWIVSKLFEKLV